MVLILFNLLLVVLSYVSYKKALKTNFPVSRGQAYVISGDQYGWVELLKMSFAIDHHFVEHDTDEIGIQ